MAVLDPKLGAVGGTLDQGFVEGQKAVGHPVKWRSLGRHGKFVLIICVGPRLTSMCPRAFFST